MFRVMKEIRFCYGHRLLNYSGECRHLHGHNGLAEITLGSETLDELGMVLDFSLIKETVKAWIDEHLDHKMLVAREDPVLPHLVEMGEPHYVFDGNPTAENIARVIFEYAKSRGFPVESVKLWETETSCAEYSG